MNTMNIEDEEVIRMVRQNLARKQQGRSFDETIEDAYNPGADGFFTAVICLLSLLVGIAGLVVTICTGINLMWLTVIAYVLMVVESGLVIYNRLK